MAPHAWRPTERKRRRSSSEKSKPGPSIPSSAYIQAYEAQLIYGQSPTRSSQSGPSQTATSSGLIRWHGTVDEEVKDHVEEQEIWLDRYDIFHLIPSIPSSSSQVKQSSPAPSSSSSWDDLPSDQEETFLLSDEEALETYHREKKRKWMEDLRSERLKQMDRSTPKSPDSDDNEGEGDLPLAEAEVLPENILTLMRHTAQALYKSPNPKQLESKILIHHSSDERFSFLRGRYTNEWEREKRKVRIEMGLEKEEVKQGTGMLGGLGGYDSDSQEEDQEDIEENEAGDIGEPDEDIPPPPPSPPSTDEPLKLPPLLSEPTSSPPPPVEYKEIIPSPASEEEIKRQRRERLEEWKRNRTKPNSSLYEMS